MPEANEKMTPEQGSRGQSQVSQKESQHRSFFQKAIEKARVSISETKQETSVPEINTVEKYNDYSRRIASLVREKFLPKSPKLNSLRSFGLRHIPTDLTHSFGRTTAPGKDHETERSLATRAVRARLYKQLKSIPENNKAARQKVLDEAHTRDEIAKAYLDQGEITVNIPEMGSQMARFAVLEPPAGRVNSQTQKPPIFLIPGISNDLDSVAGLAQEISYTGRKVITVAFPETALGRVTPEFAEATQKAKNYEPHAIFFEQALSKFVPEGDIEIWGFSTGGPIAAEMFNNPKYQERTTNAILIAPASSVDQSGTSLYLGLGHEVFGFKDTVQRYSFISGGKEGKDTKEEKRAKTDTFNALIEKVITQKAALFKDAKVRQGGKIIIVSQENDDVTKTEKAKGMFAQNPQAEVTTLKSAYHNTAVTEPERILMRVHQLQN